LAKGGKPAMPVLAAGAEKSFNTAMSDQIRLAAINVTVGIVPASGHWVMKENPDATTKLVLDFLAE
jgi:pimeloyl-ACP methyl ester carboxylesterase